MGKLPIEESDRDALEAEWADMRSIGKRLDEVSRALTSMEFDRFAIRNVPAVITALDEFDPACSIKTFFQEQFFEVRNRIVHYGEIDFEKRDGERCLLLASSLLGLLQVMDKERIKKMEEAHEKACQSPS